MLNQVRRGFYPVVFSLNDPAIIYASKDVLPATCGAASDSQKGSGFWWGFGFGMTYQYRSDFLIGGIDMELKCLGE